MKFIVSVLILLCSLLFIIGCSEINDNITPPPHVGVHPEGFGDSTSSDFHKFIFRENDWNFNLTECQSCHAANYAGGTANVSCLTCHSQPAGPEACNTCHGVFSNPDYIAPPNDLEDNSDIASKGVGAHYKHVYNNSKSTNIGCFECHQQTESEGDFVNAHIAPPPAKMEFGEFTHSDSLGLNPEYDFANLKCSNTYCHGGFKFSKSASANAWAYSEDYIVGNNYTPIWNSTTNLEAECGTCHGQIDTVDNVQILTPRPVGHFGNYQITDCANCHGSVVNSDGEIIDREKHINKLINYP